MMKLPLGLRVCSVSCFFCCIFVSCFLLNTLVSLPLPRPDQVELLLAFKNEFSSTTCDVPSPATKSWTKDAVTFDGVLFDNETRVVTELHLNDACLSGSLKANSSLFNFQHLRYLDLSHNSLVGVVSSSICNLSHLTHLDLSRNKLTGPFPSISNITKLAYIDLSANQFSGTIPSSLFTMPFLSSLILTQNHLKDPLIARSPSSSPKLTTLILSKNLFSGAILEPISKLVSLTHLDLSFNDFDSSPFPSEFGKLANLEHLDLNSNGFIREVPSSIGNLSQLYFLDLSYNKFTGSFPFVHNLTKLSSLHLHYNNFSGPIPSLITLPSSLVYLDLTANLFNDPLQYTNSSSSKLQLLYLNHNLFTGQILEHILDLVNLTEIGLSFLNITFPINFSFLPLKSLLSLDVSGNNIPWLSSNPEDVLSTKFIVLRFSSCNINELPKFLSKQQNLMFLDISSNNIKGKVPEWLWTLPSLAAASLSHNLFDSFEGSQEVILTSLIVSLGLDSNAFQGAFPTLPPHLASLSAANNNFRGDIPLSLCNTTLSFLNLANNNFSGSIPRCFGETLAVLDLHNNSLSGRLSDSFNGRYPSLEMLDVGYNQITGKLPRSLVNSKKLEILNVESNEIIDTFPFWLKTLPNLQVILLRSNGFHGPVFSPQDPLSFMSLRIIDISRNNFTGTLPVDYFVNWSATLVNVPEVYRLPEYMQNIYGVLYQPSIYLRVKGLNIELQKISASSTVIDFSGNRFGGQIPESIGFLKQLVVLDLSNNGFIGHIPSSLAKLIQLESLDLSGNRLSGPIPQELATLSFLGYINVSHNKLSGQIPQGTQFGGQSKSSFEGNVDLCGLPLQKSCFEENGSPTPKSEKSKSPKEDHFLNWKAAAIGYGPGVLVGLAIGHVMYSYKPTLYYKLFRF